MRLLAGAEIGAGAKSAATAEWGHVKAGAWLAEALGELPQSRRHGAEPILARG